MNLNTVCALILHMNIVGRRVGSLSCCTSATVSEFTLLCQVQLVEGIECERHFP